VDLTYNFFFTAAFLLFGLGAAAIIIGEVRLGSRRAAPTEPQKAYLRERAQFDRRAARQLRSCLVHELRTQQAVRRDLQGQRTAGADQAGLLQDIERAEQATRDELARVDVWLQRDR
jgi:hypothetical protein